MIATILEKYGYVKLQDRIHGNLHDEEEKGDGRPEAEKDDFRASEELKKLQDAEALAARDREDRSNQDADGSTLEQITYGLKKFIQKLVKAPFSPGASEALEVVTPGTAVGGTNVLMHGKKTDAAVDQNWEQVDRISDMQRTFNDEAKKAGVDVGSSELP